MGKKKQVNHLFSCARKVLNSKKRILFVAPVEFHVPHLEPVINQLKQNTMFEVHTLGPFSDVSGHRHFTKQHEMAFVTAYDLVVSTDFSVVPYWIAAPKAFFGHGIGPKVNYQGREPIRDFTYSFCPCSAFYQVHKQAGLQCYKIGLPILDNPTPPAIQPLLTSFGLPTDLPLLVYAPSWSGTSKVISDIPTILKKLELLSEKMNIVVSPHPNLLNPKRYSQYNLFVKTSLPVNRPGGAFNTFDLCKAAEYVVSDISSVLFESMALGKIVLFDGNREIYEFSDAGQILEQMLPEVPTVNWDEPLDTQLTAAKNYPQPNCFIQNYLYNNGRAGLVMEKAIKNILNIRECNE
ncbi:CDP-glycerol glycerophosphotransferase family protein [Salinimonas marina]|uniref:CDP-glycerol glycerophosphotransferase family protein n=1 Tax=Salinimonas marina TaxID=2785918 RepID=A0A7S9DZS8_9ALTE|nr:CDP-glycerol glycerophosphotransferase family protein [Salinimonas marina]QPG06400.1 CDP-glycerol glycerophosphotransferase family protein [Salinimonas marina]